MKKIETDYEKALRVKGYGFEYKNHKCITVPQVECINETGRKIKTIVIHTLQEFITEIDKLSGKTLINTLFYRGHTDANWLLNPSALRGNCKTEHLLINEFRRRFPEKLQNCHSFMDELVLMQHYGLHTRCLDITENPLAGLYFACADFKKYSNGKNNKSKWGEIIVFHVDNDNIDDIKYSDSSTVSIIANTAKMEEMFSLLQLEIAFKNDNHFSSISNLIRFKDIICRSVIVRTKQDNPRIKNQNGAFIICNSNKITSINGIDIPNEVIKCLYEKANGFNCNIDEAREIICSKRNIVFQSFLGPEFIKKVDSRDSDYWSFEFQKCQPYEKNENTSKILQNDPFDLDKLFYREDDKQIVFLIPPDCKNEILKQLDRLNINEEYIYPDMDSVSNELNLRINA